MYNEQIETLISAALADGVLTEKEKQILFKKAESMGIDRDEFEMVLDARLVELKKKETQEAEQHQLEMEMAKAAQKSAPKSNKYGDVRKYPACGAIVESFQTKCPECGYVFTDIKANSMTKDLCEQLDKMNTGGLFGGNTNKRVQLIKTFPIPNTREDLIEMLAMCQSNGVPQTGDGMFGSKISNAWLSKGVQVASKARFILKDDPMAQSIIAQIDKDVRNMKIKRRLFQIAMILLVILLCVGEYFLVKLLLK